METAENQCVKSIAMIRRNFEFRWETLACDDDLFANFHAWWSRFEDFLSDAFRQVFEQGKESLKRDPARFAYVTLIDWCLAADGNAPALGEVENHLRDWRDALQTQEECTRSELNPEDLGYWPVPKLSLEMVSSLQPRSPDLRRVLSEMHPHLTQAVKAVFAGHGCTTVEDAVQHFPILNGITNQELAKLRGNRAMAEVAAARELLCFRLRTVVEEATVDRYFRPKEFLPR